MAIPATCSNCSDTSLQSDSGVSNAHGPQTRPPSLPVILSVLGGMALIALIVFFVVPLVRRRRARQDYLFGDVHHRQYTPASTVLRSLTSKAGSLVTGRRTGRGRIPVRPPHRAPGPDALLPLGLSSTLPTLSTFAWSDLRSPRVSLETDEEDDTDRLDDASIPTDNATMSHRSKHDHGPASSVRSGVSIFLQDARPGRVSAASSSGLLSPQRSPSPPGISWRASAPLQHKAPSPATPIVSRPRPLPFSSPLTTRPDWLAPSSHLASMSTSKAGYFSRTENGMVSGNDPEAASRPGSIQLPSPPDSPPFPSQSRADSQPASLVRSRSTRSYSQTSQQGPPDYRFSPSRLRPPLTNTHSAPPTALPFRPVSTSSGHAPSASIHTIPSSTKLSSAPATTSSFRHGLSHSQGGSSSSSYTSHTTPHHPHTAYPPPTSPPLSPALRSRSGSIASVASELPARTYVESRIRPSELGRRASVSAHGSPLPAPMGPRSPNMPHTPLSPNLAAAALATAESRASSRVYARMSEAPRASPRYEEPSVHAAPSMSSTVYESDVRGRSRAAMASSASLQLQSPTSPLYTADRPSPANLHPSSASRQSSRGPSSSSHHAYVKKKDSPALRPLANSPFLHSPPSSPPSRSRSRSGTMGSGVATPYMGVGRSRAGSIMTLGEPPREGSEGSIHESDESAGVVDRRRNSRVTLPPIQPISPLEFETTSFSQAYERLAERREGY